MASKQMLLDYLVIGAGPAGLQLGYFLERAGQNYLILEAGNSPGTFFKRFPRHRQLISINKRYTGNENAEFRLRMDWNSLLSDSRDLLFTRYSHRFFPDADDLVHYLEEFAGHFGLKIKYGVQVTRVSKDRNFQLWDEQGNTYHCRRLIVAAGVTRPYIPPIPGIELTENYATVPVDPEDFVNQKVLVIGKGNSGFETANNLVETTATIHVAGPGPITMAWRTHYVGHLRAVNNNLLDTYQLKSQNAILDAYIDRIVREDSKFLVTARFVRANEVQKDIAYDSVITCTGFRFDDTIFDETCRPQMALNNRFPALTSEWESTNVKDLYFAGTLMQTRGYRKTTSAFIHGFRYNIRALHRMLEKKYHGRSWPARPLKPTPTALMEAVTGRVNETSALWQQFGFLGDVIRVSPGEPACYYQEMPVDYVHDMVTGPEDQTFIITLEYGPEHDKVDPFDITVGRVTQSDAENSIDSRYLHPVVRHFVGNRQVSEHHIVENLENEWFHDVHTGPLKAYFRHELANTPALSPA
ncbi:MAG: NAD(P)-binding domain-containing protein [Chloroflexi bacterium]|nr:NAD(P)-binding domain-containing protein [Chloroflexota bacterium]MCI0580876.1 NAD(P)-binding domain-containing protein [Chloroflexota bacterium]MCI0648249.1 NAD(P)-binding domain-containing protein [Chloroflexota bacterium]MCI0725931.1 NAD(P)-binding domain-containing protein [Chloroflexota bacterium]